MLDLAADRKKAARIAVLSLRGRLDALTAADFEAAVERLIQSGARFFVLRITRLESCSSSGIAALLKLSRRLESLAGKVALAETPPELGQLFDFFGLGEVLPRFENVAAAEVELRHRLAEAQWSLELTPEPGPFVEASPLSAAVESAPAQSSMAGPAKPLLKTVRRDRGGTLSSATEEGASLETRSPRRELRSTPTSLVDQSKVGALQLERWSRPTVRSSGARARAAEKIEPLAPASGGETLAEAEIADSSTRLEKTMEEPAAPATELIELFDEPQTVECNQCGQGLRAYRSGAHLCPACGNEFDVGAHRGAPVRVAP